MKSDKQYIINMLTLRYDPRMNDSKKKDWHDFTPKKNQRPLVEFTKLIKTTIKKEIEERKIGRAIVALSGGVDSSVILVTIRRLFPKLPITALTLSFGDALDETKKAGKVCEEFGCNHIVFKCENPMQDLGEMMQIVKEPRWNLYFYYVVKKAAEIGGHLFTGDGGDELFGGYSFRYQKYLANVEKSSDWRSKAITYLNCHERDWVPDQDRLFNPLMDFKWENIYSYFEPYFNNPLKPLEQVMLSDYNGKLINDFIPTNQKIAKHFGVELIAPLLDPHIQQFATHLNCKYKYDQMTGKNKPLLRKYLKTNGFLTSQGKIGFGLDLKNFWCSHGKEIVDQYLKPNLRIFSEKIISKNWFEQSVNLAFSQLDARYISKILGLVALETWLNYGDN